MANKQIVPYLLIAPAVVFLAAFFLLPLAQTIALSFDAGGRLRARQLRHAWPATSISRSRCATPSCW